MIRARRLVVPIALLFAGCGGGVGGAKMDGSGAGGGPSVTGQAGTGGPVGDPCAEGVAREINCGAAQCGNGVLDTCLVHVYADDVFICQRPFQEACDPAAAPIGDNGCQEAGYGSNIPSCSPDCTLNTSMCSGCLPAGGHIARCADASTTSAPIASSVAASDKGIALAWSAIGEDGFPTTNFEVLTPDLQVAGTSRLAGPLLADLISPPIAAPLPQGWAVVQYVEPDLIVHTVGTDGVELARVVVATIPRAMLLGWPTVAARANGGPLIAWQIQDVIQEAVLSDDGRSLSPTRQIQYTGPGPISATYAGGAFYVGFTIRTPSSASQLRLQRVETDGRPSTAINAIPGQLDFLAQVVAGAADLQVVYPRSPSGSGLIWQKIDQTGAPASPATVITDPMDSLFSGDPRAVALGTDIVIARESYAGFIQVMRIGPDGDVVTPGFTVAQVPALSGTMMVSRGAEVVVGWTRDLGWIELARVTP